MKYSKKRHNKKRISKKNKHYGGSPQVRVVRINRNGQKFDKNYSGPEKTYYKDNTTGEIYDIETKLEVGIWNPQTNEIDFYEGYEDEITNFLENKKQMEESGPINCDKCIICQEAFFKFYINTPNLYIHNCKNMFHTECLTKWCKDKPNCVCPMCRQLVENLI